MQDQATTTDLTTLPPAERAAVALGSSKTETTLRELAQQSAEITAVVDLPGRDEAHRAGMSLKNARTAITKTGKAARDDANAFCSAVIAEEKRLIAIVEPEEKRVLGLRDGFDAKLAAEKAERDRIEAKRVAAIKAKIEGIRSLPAVSFRDSAAELAATLQDLTDFDITEVEFVEFAAEAAQVRAVSLSELQILLDSAIAAEAEAARLAAERAELERLQAEQAERERVSREQREQEEARLAEERAAFEAERDAFAKQKAEAEQAEQARQEALRPATIEQPATALYSTTTFKDNGDPIMLNKDGSRSIFCDIDEGGPGDDSNVVDASFTDDSEQVAQFANAVRALRNTRSALQIRGLLEHELVAIEAELKEVA